MKKIVLLFSALLLFAQADARIRATQVNPSVGSIKIKNVAGFAHDYTNFVLSINGAILNLSLQAISGGADMNLDTDEEVTITGLTIPSAASLAIWYNGVDPNGTVMTSDLVDFMQFGSAGHEHEALAVTAGLWSTGEFVDGAGPYTHSGSGEGASQWTGTGTTGLAEATTEGLSVYPNPCVNQVRVNIPTAIQSVDITVINAIGQTVESIQSFLGNASISVSDLKEGVYFMQVSNKGKTIDTIRLLKTN